MAINTVVMSTNSYTTWRDSPWKPALNAFAITFEGRLF